MRALEFIGGIIVLGLMGWFFWSLSPSSWGGF